MNTTDKPGGADKSIGSPSLQDSSGQQIIDNRKNQKLGIRIERNENATWTLGDRQELRMHLFKIFGIKQVGINANTPECIATIPAGAEMKIDGVVIKDIGTLHVDESVKHSDQWRDAALDVAEQENPTPMAPEGHSSPEAQHTDAAGEHNAVKAA